MSYPEAAWERWRVGRGVRSRLSDEQMRQYALSRYGRLRRGFRPPCGGLGGLTPVLIEIHEIVSCVGLHLLILSCALVRREQQALCLGELPLLDQRSPNDQQRPTSLDRASDFVEPQAFASELFGLLVPALVVPNRR